MNITDLQTQSLNLLDLQIELLIYITEFLNDKDKLNFFSVNKFLFNSRNLLTFNDYYDYKKTQHVKRLKKFNLKLYRTIYDNNISKNIKLNNVKKLIIKCNKDIFTKNIDLFEKNNIEEIEFFANYNKPIINLPNSIKRITFHRGSLFNHELNNLSNSINKIIFNDGYNFNQSIPDNLINKVIFIGLRSYKYDNVFSIINITSMIDDIDVINNNIIIYHNNNYNIINNNLFR